jgi:hypothetical protein
VSDEKNRAARAREWLRIPPDAEKPLSVLELVANNPWVLRRMLDKIEPEIQRLADVLIKEVEEKGGISKERVHELVRWTLGS